MTERESQLMDMLRRMCDDTGCYKCPLGDYEGCEFLEFMVCTRASERGGRMSATDELRKLLDERGVEHCDGAESTLWCYEPIGEGVSDYRYAADETANGRMHVLMFGLTPAQAVEATLGSNMLTAERVRDAIERHSTETLGCRRQFREQDWQAIADELNAELANGRGKCRNIGYGLRFECSECHQTVGGETPRFCPNCGREVER